MLVKQLNLFIDIDDYYKFCTILFVSTKISANNLGRSISEYFFLLSYCELGLRRNYAVIFVRMVTPLIFSNAYAGH
jgi:hypothetical protein